jgi:hypothetical protein
MALTSLSTVHDMVDKASRGPLCEATSRATELDRHAVSQLLRRTTQPQCLHQGSSSEATPDAAL